MKIKNSIAISLIFLLWTFLSLSSGAQEDNEAETAADPETTANEESTTEEISNTETVEPNDENFVPTQQISEDLSVSFPVDI